MGEKVLGYARISVSHEDLENQKRAIEEYCRKKGYDLLAIIEDVVTGISKPMERPGFRKLIDLIQTLGVRKVIAVALDRIARGGVLEAYEILNILRNRGVVIEFVRDQNINPDDPIIYNTFIHAFALAAELEIKARKRRMEDAKRAGKRIGRPAYDIPWDKVKSYLAKGLNIKDVYRILVADGYLKRTTKDGRTQVMSYRRFLERVKMELGPDIARQGRVTLVSTSPRARKTR